jgi:hypothetical protein
MYERKFYTEKSNLKKLVYQAGGLQIAKVSKNCKHSTGGKLVEKNAIIFFARGDQPTLHNGHLGFLKNKIFLHKMF